MSIIKRLWDALSQEEAERDPEFRGDLQRRSWLGLKTVGWALVAAPLVMLTVMRMTFPETATPASAALTLSVSAVGALTLGWQKTGKFRQHARSGAFLVSVVVSWASISSLLLRASKEPVFLYLISAEVAVVLLIVLLAIPFRPVQVLLIGLLAELYCGVSFHWAVRSGLLPSTEGGDVNLLFLSLLTALSTGVSVGRYQQVRESYAAYKRQLEAAERLRDAQCRMVLSDTAASMGRLAAALSHELNNPLSVLKSSLDTMKGLIIEDRPAPPDKQAALERMKAQLCRNAQEAVERLQGIVARMQRFTNLDRAEILPVNLNELLEDVAEIVKDALGKPVTFRWDRRPIPEVMVKPQLMSAAFSAILTHAAQAGGEESKVQVGTRLKGDHIQVEVRRRDAGGTGNTREMTMEPAFRVEDNRIAASNWNLFAARQIVHQHGGDVEIRTDQDGAPVVEVTLPATRLARL